MFESSLLPLRDGGDRRRAQRIVAASLSAQVAALVLMAVMPLLYPAQMPPFRTARLKTVELLRPRHPIPMKPVIVKQEGSSAMRVPVAPALMRTTTPILSRPAAPALVEPALLPYGESRMSTTGVSSILGSSLGTTSGTSVVPGQESSAGVQVGPVRLSSGVTSGMLLSPIRPEYPQIAKVTRTEGTVVVTARIDATGRIVGLRVVSGPAMLRAAAEDAVREARYRPYLLNGQPTEVETTIAVSFHIGG